jgi:hypothetical protein
LLSALGTGGASWPGEAGAALAAGHESALQSQNGSAPPAFAGPPFEARFNAGEHYWWDMADPAPQPGPVTAVRLNLRWAKNDPAFSGDNTMHYDYSVAAGAPAAEMGVNGQFVI